MFDALHRLQKPLIRLNPAPSNRFNTGTALTPESLPIVVVIKILLHLVEETSLLLNFAVTDSAIIHQMLDEWNHLSVKQLIHQLVDLANGPVAHLKNPTPLGDGDVSKEYAKKALTERVAHAVRAFHRELFQCSLGPLRGKIERIADVAVREATEEIEPTTGVVVQVFWTGTIVQVFQLNGGLSAEAQKSD